LVVDPGRVVRAGVYVAPAVVGPSGSGSSSPKLIGRALEARAGRYWYQTGGLLMRSVRLFVMSGWLFALALGSLGLVPGCGDAKEGEVVKVDEKANEQQQKSMQDFMQKKQQTKK
jgi:hypothetical protein